MYYGFKLEIYGLFLYYEGIRFHFYKENKKYIIFLYTISEYILL